MARSHRNGADGVVAHKPGYGVSDHPVRSFQRWLGSIFLLSRPPLLRRKEGNTPLISDFFDHSKLHPLDFAFDHQRGLGQPLYLIDGNIRTHFS